MKDAEIPPALQPIIEEYGAIPKPTMLEVMGKGDLVKAIVREGGFKKYCDLLGTTLLHYYVSADGHQQSSSYECIFDNILAKHNIVHEIQVRVVPYRRYRCDFYIGDTYIEILGYMRKENSEYFSALDKKIRLYKKHHKNYLLIPRDVFRRDKAAIEKEVLRRLGDLVNCKGGQKQQRKIDILDFKPGYYWVNASNVEKALLPLIDKYGRMPTDQEFRKERAAGLVCAIYKFYGSPFDLGRKLGVAVLHKPKGYYAGRSGIVAYIKRSLSMGRHPIQRELMALGEFGLIKVAQQNGGWHKLRVKSKLAFPGIRGPYGEYTLSKIVRRYKRLCIEAGRFLIKKELYALGFDQLANAISRNGGIYNIRERTGLNYSHVLSPPGYHSIEDLVNDYKCFCKAKGYFLTQREIRVIFTRQQIGFISRNIRLCRLREMTGLKLKVKRKRPKKRYTLAKATAEYKARCVRAGRPLTGNELKLAGEEKLARCISVEIGYKKIRKKAGLKFPGRKTVQFKEAVAAHKERCLKVRRYLSAGELSEMRLCWLAGRIERLGGFGKIRKACRLSFPELRERHGLAKVVARYGELCLKKGYFLEASDLRSLGHEKLGYAIAYWGGFRKIRKLTKLNLKKKPAKKRSPAVLAGAVRKFRQLSIRNGSFCSKNELIALGFKQLAWFIQNNGGYREFQRLSGLRVSLMHKVNQKGALG